MRCVHCVLQFLPYPLNILMGSIQVTLVAESFGGCLALRVAKEAPELLERMVLVNPATAFATSWGGLPNVFASTQLLSVFPKPLYEVRASPSPF